MNETKKNKKGKKKNGLAGFLLILGSVLIGAAAGFLIAGTGLGEQAKSSMERQGFVLWYLGVIAAVALGFYGQLIIHEGGHLVFGLLSGYRFVSFRVGSRMLLKTGEGMKWKRLSLAGTGGQCLLAPSGNVDEECPFRLYNHGGWIFNLLTGALAALLRAFVREGFFANLLLMLALAGFWLAVSNGVPLQTALISNDGANVRDMKRSADARRAFRLQLAINEQQMEGLRLRDMPEEWFILSEEADRGNTLIVCVDGFAENRSMDEQNFDRARQQIDALLTDGVAVPGINRTMLLLDRVYIELLEKGAEADTSPLEAKENKAVIRQMKNYPSVLRTQYAAAVLKDKDAAGAEKLLAAFEKTAKSYPAPGELASERELIELAREKAASAEK